MKHISVFALATILALSVSLAAQEATDSPAADSTKEKKEYTVAEAQAAIADAEEALKKLQEVPGTRTKADRDDQSKMRKGLIEARKFLSKKLYSTAVLKARSIKKNAERDIARLEREAKKAQKKQAK